MFRVCSVAQWFFYSGDLGVYNEKGEVGYNDGKFETSVESAEILLLNS